MLGSCNSYTEKDVKKTCVSETMASYFFEYKVNCTKHVSLGQRSAMLRL